MLSDHLADFVAGFIDLDEFTKRFEEVRADYRDVYGMEIQAIDTLIKAKNVAALRRYGAMVRIYHDTPPNHRQENRRKARMDAETMKIVSLSLIP